MPVMWFREKGMIVWNRMTPSRAVVAPDGTSRAVTAMWTIAGLSIEPMLQTSNTG
jgi:hypothetical protein